MNGPNVMLTIVLNHPATNLLVSGPKIADQTVVITFDKMHDIRGLLASMKFGENTEKVT